MKFNFFLLVFTFFVFNKTYSQNYLEYYKLINEAEINSLDKNYVKADSLYQMAFSVVEDPFKEDCLLAAKNATQLNNDQKVFDFLIRGIRSGLTLKRVKYLKKEFLNFFHSKLYKVLKTKYEVLRNKYLKSIDIILRNEISEMIKNDQKARIPILGSWKQMKKVDTYNYNRLLEIIKENNDKWPGFSVIGEITPKGKYDVSGNIALMLLHFKKEQIEILKPYMLEAVENGEMYPYQYARIIDYKNRCQIYGTYKINNKIESTKICNCENAEKEREKIGFEPLEDYYRKINSTYECKE